MAVLQLPRGIYLIGFLHPADDLGTAARRSRNVSEFTPPWHPPTPAPQQRIETGFRFPLLSRALGDGERERIGVASFLFPAAATDLGTGGRRRSRNASFESTAPRQPPTPPQRSTETGFPLLSRALGDREGIGIGVGSTRVVGDGDGDGDGGFLHGADPVPPRNRGLMGVALLHLQHGDADVEHGDAGGEDVRTRARLLSDVGDRDLVGAAALHHQQYSDAYEGSPAHSLLRLRGGAADYYPAALPPEFSWKEVIGSPMVQTIPNTCALVAATVCVEAQHRREFEAVYGAGTFVCRAAAPRRLRQACSRDKFWNPTGEHERTWDAKKGARGLQRVLHVLKRLGGARTTNAPPPAPFLMPLHDWESCSYEDGGLTAETAARLLHDRGPCIGTLFATKQFFDTFVLPESNLAPAVFRGCRREHREQVMKFDDPNAAMHTVVCYAYFRSDRGRLCIFVLDNQRASGPIRCVDFEEFDEFFVLYVEALPPLHLLDFDRFPPLQYPESGC